MTYDELLRRLGRRVSVQVDKRRGTEIRRAPGEAGDHGDLQVRYRGTAVVTLHPDRTYTLRTGGTASKTVIRRIAEYSPISLVRRGNGFYIQDAQTGRLMPFLEGTRVNEHGQLVGANSSEDLVLPGGATAPSDAQLRDYIRRVVQETLAEQIAPAERTQRQVRMRATVSPTPVEPEAPLVSLDVVEKLLQDSLSPEKAKRAVRDLKNSLLRGRDKADDVSPGEAAPVHVATCSTCRVDLVAHYDGANRYRGCDYALRHKDSALV
jgi:hypothetical protein